MRYKEIHSDISLMYFICSSRTLHYTKVKIFFIFSINQCMADFLAKRRHFKLVKMTNEGFGRLDIARSRSGSEGKTENIVKFADFDNL